MPRSRIGKTKANNTKWLKFAVKEEMKNRLSVRKSSDYESDDDWELPELPAFDHWGQVFTYSEEKRLVEYLNTAIDLHYGLTLTSVRKLTYNYAKYVRTTVPSNWERNKVAGCEWLSGFRKRWPYLSLEKPQSRATSLNKENLLAFFKKYRRLINDYGFSPENIYNLDETSNIVANKSTNELALKYISQQGYSKLGKNEINITMISCVNALGTSVPPMLIFPRVQFKDHMINGGPYGCIGEANSSGQLNDKIFFKYFDHFINFAKPSIKNPVLLLMDNHESHLSIDVIEAAELHCVHLLTFHPHTKHEVQPLVKAVFGPYKTYFNNEVKNFKILNPGKLIKINDLVPIIGKSYDYAFTPTNIKKGFTHTGLCPLNEKLYNDSEHLDDIEVSQALKLTKGRIKGECQTRVQEKEMTLEDLATIASEAETTNDRSSISPAPELTTSREERQELTTSREERQELTTSREERQSLTELNEEEITLEDLTTTHSIGESQTNLNEVEIILEETTPVIKTFKSSRSSDDEDVEMSMPACYGEVFLEEFIEEVDDLPAIKVEKVIIGLSQDCSTGDPLAVQNENNDN